MKTKLKPVVARVGDAVVSVSVMRDHFITAKPLAHLYAAITSCVAIHVKKAVDKLGLSVEEVSVAMGGELVDAVLISIDLTIDIGQEHPYGKTLEAAALNCQVIQHLDPEIKIRINVL